MKRKRFMTIDIVKQGNPQESFDPSEYLKALTERPKTCCGIAFFTEGSLKEETKIPYATISVTTSWNEAPYHGILLRYCRHVLWIFAIACRQAIDDLYSRIVFSKIGR